MVFDVEDYDARFWRTFGVERLKALLQEPNLKTIPAAGVPLVRPSLRRGRSSASARTTGDPRQGIRRQGAGISRLFLQEPRLPQRPARFPSASSPAWSAWNAKLRTRGRLGKRASGIHEGEALSHVAGYRRAQRRDQPRLQKARLQWFFAKSADSFGPLGPWLRARATKSSAPTPSASASASTAKFSRNPRRRR
jgi:hypothetical protein